ncbi:hypothetical protein N665_0979s0005 [Sinapis alba]|nr:hypothetical protein N665_0979s0005 [Sinapis alba]
MTISSPSVVLVEETAWLADSSRRREKASSESGAVLDEAKRLDLCWIVSRVGRKMDDGYAIRKINVYSVVVGCDQCVCIDRSFSSSLSSIKQSFFSILYNVSLSSSQPLFPNTPLPEDDGETATEQRERCKWTPSDDILLISLWLNTSKDPVVSNEQRSGTFWTRVAAYFAANSQVPGLEQREASHCKQRRHKINDLVCKFCGAYEAASREKTSGQNDNDVLKLAHQIFYTNQKKKFTLKHAWKELRNDQKWCELATKDASSKKRKCDDSADSSSSQATENKRPPGVKSAKASGKQSVAEENRLNAFQNMWKIKQADMAMKERLSKLALLDSLIGKKEPLSEFEEALKIKLIHECLSN